MLIYLSSSSTSQFNEAFKNGKDFLIHYYQEEGGGCLAQPVFDHANYAKGDELDIYIADSKFAFMARPPFKPFGGSEDFPITMHFDQDAHLVVETVRGELPSILR
jgi:hypothetical protein